MVKCAENKERGRLSALDMHYGQIIPKISEKPKTELSEYDLCRQSCVMSLSALAQQNRELREKHLTDARKRFKALPIFNYLFS